MNVPKCRPTPWVAGFSQLPRVAPTAGRRWPRHRRGTEPAPAGVRGCGSWPALRLEPGGGPRVDPPAPPSARAEAPPRANPSATTPAARPHPPRPQPPASSAAPAPAPPPPAWSAPSPARAGPPSLFPAALAGSLFPLPTSPSAALPSGEESSAERIDRSALCGRPAPNSSVRSELDFPRRRPRRRRHSGGGGGGGGFGGGGGSASTPGPRHFGLGASAAQALKAAAGARGSAAPRCGREVQSGPPLAAPAGVPTLLAGAGRGRRRVNELGVPGGAGRGRGCGAWAGGPPGGRGRLGGRSAGGDAATRGMRNGRCGAEEGEAGGGRRWGCFLDGEPLPSSSREPRLEAAGEKLAGRAGRPSGRSGAVEVTPAALRPPLPLAVLPSPSSPLPHLFFPS